MCAQADTDRSAGGATHIIAGERTGSQSGRRGNHCPNHNPALDVSDIDAKTRNAARVILVTAWSGKSAIERARRAEHETNTARDIAGQGPDNNTWLLLL